MGLALHCATPAQAQGMPPEKPPEKPLAIASISILADFARAIAGDAIRVESIVHVGGDPHTYEPVPSDSRRLANAQLVLRNGLGLERWLDKLIGRPSPSRPVATVTDGLVPHVEETGKYEGAPDPHLWMDPVLVLHYVEATRAALAARFPHHAPLFAENARKYAAELAALDREIRARMETIPPQSRKLVTTHDAFRYFGKRYGLEVLASIWGISTESEPSAREIQAIVDAVRTARVPAVFVETTVNPKLMERIASDAGTKIGQPLFGDSVGAPGTPEATYIGMMRANARAIARGLGGADP